MDKHINIFAQSIEQPRVVKRILELAYSYKTVTVYAYSRGIYEVGNYKVLEGQNNIEIVILGTLKDGKYFSRIVLYMKFIVRIVKQYGFKSKLMYVFGLDLRMVTFGIPNTKVFYEISDIIWLYKSKVPKKVLSIIDAFLAKKSYQVTFTSEGFYKAYYNFLDSRKVRIKENKFKTYGRVKSLESINTEKLKVAYIGSFRYYNIIKFLIESVAKNNHIDLNFYGDSNVSIVQEIKKACNNYENISYEGKFKNPDDLERIYSENNLNFVVYDNKLENEQVAMPNKFYESGFFNIPIVVATNTFVGKKVLEMKMGWTIDATKESINHFLTSISLDDVKKRHHHIRTIDKSFFKT